MQVYRRIANPFMPQGTPDKTNALSPYYAPGELGCAFSDQNTGNEYLRVQLDSGATAATGVGIVAVGQLAFWKNQAQSIVTNDKAQCDAGPSGAINRVAGVFQAAVSTNANTNGTDGLPIMYMCDLVIRTGGGSPVNMAAGTALIGAQITADTTASTARGTFTTGVNTAPVSQVLGVWTSSTITNGLCPAQISIGFAE